MTDSPIPRGSSKDLASKNPLGSVNHCASTSPTCSINHHASTNLTDSFYHHASKSQTGSFILAQGNALGKPEQRNKQPEGLPHNPAIRLHPGKKQVFSLQRFATHFHKALPWASVHETFAL